MSKWQYDGKFHTHVKNSRGEKCNLGGFVTAEEVRVRVRVRVRARVRVRVRVSGLGLGF